MASVKVIKSIIREIYAWRFTELKALENLYIQKSLKISFFFVQ
jgi:hypothetical protein